MKYLLLKKMNYFLFRNICTTLDKNEMSDQNYLAFSQEANSLVVTALWCDVGN